MKKQKNKKITVSDFKMWLDGFLAFQGEDWHPTKEQWEVILDKINNLQTVEISEFKSLEVNKNRVKQKTPHSTSTFHDYENDDEGQDVIMPKARLMDMPAEQQALRSRPQSTKDFVESVEVGSDGIPKSPFI